MSDGGRYKHPDLVNVQAIREIGAAEGGTPGIDVAVLADALPGVDHTDMPEVERAHPEGAGTVVRVRIWKDRLVAATAHPRRGFAWYDEASDGGPWQVYPSVAAGYDIDAIDGADGADPRRCIDPRRFYFHTDPDEWSGSGLTGHEVAATVYWARQIDTEQTREEGQRILAGLEGQNHAATATPAVPGPYAAPPPGQEPQPDVESLHPQHPLPATSTAGAITDLRAPQPDPSVPAVHGLDPLARLQRPPADGDAGGPCLPVLLQAEPGTGSGRMELPFLPDPAASAVAARVTAALDAAGYPLRGPTRIELYPDVDHPPARGLRTGIGAGLDLPIAVAVLARDGVLPRDFTLSNLLVGRLGSDAGGSRIAADGVGLDPELLQVAAQAADAHQYGMLTTAPGLRKPAWTGSGYQQIRTLRQLVNLAHAETDLRTLIAAAGGHHTLLTGPYGPARDQAARAIWHLLPDLTDQQASDLTRLGLGDRAGPNPRPPFVDATGDTTLIQLLGSRARIGAVTEAHLGLLHYQDPDKRNALELCGVLERRASTFVHGGQHYTRSADCLLVTAAGHTQAKEFGPLRDRSAITIPVEDAPCSQGGRLEIVRKRVAELRDRQAERYHGEPWNRNAHVPADALIGRYPAEPDAMRILDQATGFLTRRGRGQVLAVAWTLADATGSSRPTVRHVVDAWKLRDGTSRLDDSTWIDYEANTRHRALTGVPAIAPATAAAEAPPDRPDRGRTDAQQGIAMSGHHGADLDPLPGVAGPELHSGQDSRVHPAPSQPDPASPDIRPRPNRR